MYASHYLVVETVNNLRIIERGQLPRSLSPEERNKIKNYLSGPLGVVTKGKNKGQPKRSVTVADLRILMGWGPATKTTPFHFTIEKDEDREINTDWFCREIVHGAITYDKWMTMSDGAREGINRAVLKHDPDDEKQAKKLKVLLMNDWAGLTEKQADALVAAWKRRPRPDKRLSMSRRAVRNLLVKMDRDEPWPDENILVQSRWLTQIEARKLISRDAGFLDVTTGKPLNDHAHHRYSTGTKGATARDRHYMRVHLLKKNGLPVYGPDGLPLHEPAPAPLVRNPVVRKAIHEVRRHLIEYMITMERKPDEVYIELAREAKMGKADADRSLFISRLRSRIRKDIIATFNLDSLTSTQQRVAVERVVLAVQQNCTCPFCGRIMDQNNSNGITLRTAALGQGCELAHIVPKASGGHNGLANIVLAHRECNRNMDRRTPRQFWNDMLPGGFEEGIQWIESIYGNIVRIKPSEVKSTTGIDLWKCFVAEQGRPRRGAPSANPPNYFSNRCDWAKIEQFKKDIKDIQGMTRQQEAATKYAARQVMAYLADALYDGHGLPERSCGSEQSPEIRRIFTTDGLWTSRLRREWGLFFDRHGGKATGLTSEQRYERQEKNRGDHRHHAIDAIVTALTTAQIRNAWEEREKKADRVGINTADDEAMQNYRRLNPLPPPSPFRSRDDLRNAVQFAVFGEESLERPVGHRPVKRKLIGALHKETLLGAALDKNRRLTNRYTVKKTVLELTPNHLRVPEGWDELSAQLDEPTIGAASKREIRRKLASMDDVPPGKSGMVRDRNLRDRIRKCLCAAGLELGVPNYKKHTVKGGFTSNQLKKLISTDILKHASGVPINSVVLLRTMTDPVLTSRWATDYKSGKRYCIFDAMTGEGDASAVRAYDSQNNHHIEIRVGVSKKGKEVWSAEIVTAYQASQRKLAKFKAYRDAGVPKLKAFRKLSKEQRREFRSTLREIEMAHPIVDRSDCETKGGSFVMSLSEGEMLLLRHKTTMEVGYFVVAELVKEKKQVVLVPHWDARKASKRKNAEGKEVNDSMRDEFAVTPTDLSKLAPPGHAHAVKVRVSPLGKVTHLLRD